MSDPILIDPGPSPRGWHHASDALHCMQWYAYRHELRLQFTPGEALIRGSMLHTLLAHHYARMGADNGAGVFVEDKMHFDRDDFYTPEDALSAVLVGKDAVWRRESVKVWDAFDAYRVAFAHERLQPLAVETVIAVGIKPRAGAIDAKWDAASERWAAVPRTEPYYYTQRFDLIAREARGIMAFDHKSAMRLGKRTTERYTLSGQFLGLRRLGEHRFGSAFGGVVLNMIRLGDSPKTQRVRPEPAPNALTAFPDAIRDAEEDIARLRTSGRDPWHWPKRLNEQVCTTIYGRCPAYELCRWGKAALRQDVPVEPPPDVEGE